MKNITIILRFAFCVLHKITICLCSLLFALCSITTTGCQKSERTPEGNIKITVPTLTLAQNNVWFLDSADATFENRFLMRVSWSEARFTYENGVAAYPDNVKYTLELDTSDFENPFIVNQPSTSHYIDLWSQTLKDQTARWNGNVNIDTSFYASMRVRVSAEGFADVFSNQVVLKIDPVIPIDEDNPLVIPEYIIKVKKSAECTWGNIYVYAWGAEEVYGSWPGLKLVADNNGWYELTVPGERPIHLILNNGSGGGTSQQNFLNDPTADGCYEITNTSFTQMECE